MERVTFGYMQPGAGPSGLPAYRGVVSEAVQALKRGVPSDKPAEIALGWICADDLEALGQSGQAVIYAQQQQFAIAAPIRQVRVVLTAAAPTQQPEGGDARDMINALERAAQRLEADRDAVVDADPQDVRAEFAATDALLMRQAASILRGETTLRPTFAQALSYDAGWRSAATRAARRDLLADVYRPAYAKERDAALQALSPHAPPTPIAERNQEPVS
ncbi:hypothetical protein [Ramlibacter sp. AN1133]|uniref:hypothetical protein n=1 Tax=Ramlibacter sp. AN1133 TaxID=3133429 RepID=UPI0030C1EF46